MKTLNMCLDVHHIEKTVILEHWSLCPVYFFSYIAYRDANLMEMHIKTC